MQIAFRANKRSPKRRYFISVGPWGHHWDAQDAVRVLRLAGIKTNGCVYLRHLPTAIAVLHFRIVFDKFYTWPSGDGQMAWAHKADECLSSAGLSDARYNVFAKDLAQAKAVLRLNGFEIEE